MDEGEAAIAIAEALEGSDIKATGLDTGEIFVTMPDGTKFALTLEEVEDFPIDEDDDDDGISGQDRESYSDDQDRDSYTVDGDED
tara:strand:- start:530 stop:784 length:255 start_codon:yes stop_codon:yes gene_type:complete